MYVNPPQFESQTSINKFFDQQFINQMSQSSTIKLGQFFLRIPHCQATENRSSHLMEISEHLLVGAQ